MRDTATSLSLLSAGGVSRQAVLASVADAVASRFSVWEREGFSPAREAWLAGNCTLGRTVLLPAGYGHAEAVAKDIDDTGALIAVAEDGTTIRIDSGEIFLAERRNSGQVARE